MTLEQIRYIVEVASVGSITKAAHNLFISQPNLSTAIKNLEEELGYEIFIRSKNGTSLTYNGIQLLHHARSIQIQLDEIKKLDKSAKDEVKHLTVLTQINSTSMLKLVSLCEDYADSPFQFYYRQCPFASILREIMDMKADVGVVYYPIKKTDVVHKLFWDNQIEEIILDKYPLNIGVLENHPLASRDKLTLDDIADYPLIMLNGNEADTFYADFLNTIGYFSHRQKIRVGDIFSMYYMLDCLKGVSFVLHAEERMFSMYPKELRLFPVPDLQPFFVSVIYKKSFTPREEIRHFLKKFPNCPAI